MVDTHPIARYAARDIIRSWGFFDPSQIDLELVAAEQNVMIARKPIHGSTARLVCNPSGGLIVVDDSIQQSSRVRFAIAHELGHYLLHQRKSSISVCTDESFMDWYNKSGIEVDANVFASELLMPRDLFERFIHSEEPTFDSVRQLSALFSTSITATAIRYVELCDYPCAIVASVANKVNWVIPNPLFSYRILDRGTLLNPVSLAGEYFQKSIQPTGPQDIPGFAWLQESHFGDKCRIFEDVIVMPSYGIALSLIWIHDDQSIAETDLTVDHYDPDHFTPDGKRYRW